MEKEEKRDQQAKEFSQKEIVQTVVHQNGNTYTKTYGGLWEMLQDEDGKQKAMATKIIMKSKLDSNRLRYQVANQIKLHKSLRHPNIVEFYSSFDDQLYHYINLELCENGSIIDLLRVRQTLTTPEIQSILLGLCEGVEYLHSRGIIHRDLKIANLFLNEKNIVKIGDFGLATRLEMPHQRKRTACGTPNYIAPQILVGAGYSYEVDIWSIGIVIYSLFCCVGPFGHEQSDQQMYKNIKKCQFSFPYYHKIPKQGIDLINKILVPNPSHRPTIQEIKNHPFMKLGAFKLLGLPKIILTRTPTKKQLYKWSVCQGQSFNEQKSMVGKNPSCIILRHPKRSLCQGRDQKFLFDETKACFVVICQKMDENLVFFLLNNGNYGVVDVAKKEMHVKNMKQNGEIVFRSKVNVIKMDENSKFNVQKIEQINVEDCPHRVLISLKEKQMKSTEYRQIRKNLQLNMPKYHIRKFIKSSKDDFFIFKLDPPQKKTIQIIFQDNNDGCLIFNDSTLLYFPSFLPTRDLKQNKVSQYEYWKIKNPLEKDDNELRYSEGRKPQGVQRNENIRKGLNWRKINIMRQVLKQTLGKKDNQNQQKGCE